MILPQVAWVRVDTQTILTIHNNVITRNPRISLSRPGENKWYLHLNSAQESDRGWYMCQINTDPMVHRSGYVQVVGRSRLVLSQLLSDPPPSCSSPHHSADRAGPEHGGEGGRQRDSLL